MGHAIRPLLVAVQIGLLHLQVRSFSYKRQSAKGVVLDLARMMDRSRSQMTQSTRIYDLREMQVQALIPFSLTIRV